MSISPGALERVNSKCRRIEDWLQTVDTSDATSSSSLTTTSRDCNGSQALFAPLDAHPLISLGAISTANSCTNNDKHQPFANPQPHESQLPFMAFPVDHMHKLPRYYANNLSKEDKHTLTHGEENHNLKQWTGWDLVRHHESRRSLIPQVMPKVEKMNALTDIEHGKQYSQRAIPKAKVKDKVLDKEYQESTCIQSTHGHRSTSSSPARSPSTPSLAPDNNATEPYSPRHPRPSSSSDYFSHRPTHRASSSSYHRRISPLALSPGLPSDSSRVRSPLSHQVSFQPNPDITFDTFLAPHKSGKGEVLQEVADAKKSGAAKRLSKMPSMPLLRKRTEID